MNNLHKSLLVSLGFACSCSDRQPIAVAAPQMFHSTYVAEDGFRAHIVGAMDDGHDTAIAFDRVDFIASIAGPRGEPITYSRLGVYAQMPGVYDRLTVRSNGHSVELTHLPSKLPPPLAPAEPAPASPLLELTHPPTVLASTHAQRPTNSISVPPGGAAPGLPIDTAPPALRAPEEPLPKTDPLPDIDQVRDWTVIAGEELSDTITRWAAIAAYTPKFEHPEYHYPVEIGGVLHCSFTDAVRSLKVGFRFAPHPPDFRIKQKNRAIIVTATDESSEAM